MDSVPCMYCNAACILAVEAKETMVMIVIARMNGASVSRAFCLLCIPLLKSCQKL